MEFAADAVLPPAPSKKSAFKYFAHDDAEPPAVEVIPKGPDVYGVTSAAIRLVGTPDPVRYNNCNVSPVSPTDPVLPFTSGLSDLALAVNIIILILCTNGINSFIL